MSYVDENLMIDETVIYKANVHWLVFLPTITTFLTSVSLVLIGSIKKEEIGLIMMLFGLFLFVLSILSFINALIIKNTTELAITSKRVIAKTGLISRRTTELNHSKVESFKVNQSIFGRIFNCGTIVINGTGGGKTRINNIDDPLNFRRQAMEIIDHNQAHSNQPTQPN
jgi:uncharacterized membrane protein YdbT with pleckstrin-like domain